MVEKGRKVFTLGVFSKKKRKREQAASQKLCEGHGGTFLFSYYNGYLHNLKQLVLFLCCMC